MIALLILVVAIGFISVEAAIKNAAEQASRDAARNEPKERHRIADWYVPPSTPYDPNAPAPQDCAPFTSDEQASARYRIARAMGRPNV